ADAGVTHATTRHRDVDRGQRLVQRSQRVERMQLPQVDVRRLQPFERRVQRVEQVTARRVAAAILPAPADRLRRDDDVLASYDALQHPADDTLALAFDVHVGGVDEI